MNQEAYMASPLCGDTNVDPQSEILIIFNHPYAYISDVFIKINGEYAVKNGEASPDFIIVRMNKNVDSIRFGIRKRGGLPPSSIMVQAWCSKECRTINEIFFVKNAQSKMHIAEPNAKIQKCKGGYVVSNNKVLESGLEINTSLQEISFLNKKKEKYEKIKIPKLYMKTYSNYHGHLQEEDWVFLISNKSSSLMMGNKIKFKKEYDFPILDININHQFIQGRRPRTGKTYHLPFTYSPTEKDNFWFEMIFDNYSEYNKCKLYGTSQAWFNDHEIIFRYNCDPIMKEYMEILWTSADIGANRIKDINIINNSSAVINNSFLINFINPSVYKL